MLRGSYIVACVVAAMLASGTVNAVSAGYPKHLAPVPSTTSALMVAKDTSATSPILMDLAREPTRRCAGFYGAGRAFLASMRSERACASPSPICPAAYAFHNAAETRGSSHRGDASTARRSWSVNMCPSGR